MVMLTTRGRDKGSAEPEEGADAEAPAASTAVLIEMLRQQQVQQQEQQKAMMAMQERQQAELERCRNEKTSGATV